VPFPDQMQEGVNVEPFQRFDQAAHLGQSVLFMVLAHQHE
jgi:hypothetical protein